MTIYSEPGFCINTSAPDIYKVHHKGSCWDTFHTDREPTFMKFRSRYFPESHLGYLRADRGVYAGEGGYENAGSCICKIVDIKSPILDIKKTLFYRSLKDVHYTAGQIIIALPSGRTIPVFSNTAEIHKFSDWWWISQKYSSEFMRLWSEYNYRSDKTWIYIYKKNDREDRADLVWRLKEMAKYKKLWEKERVQRSQTNNTTQKADLTDDEILSLWKGQ